MKGTRLYGQSPKERFQKIALYAALVISGGYVVLTLAKTAKTRETLR